MIESGCRFDGAFDFLFLTTDEHGYQNLHLRLFASICGSKFSKQ